MIDAQTVYYVAGSIAGAGAVFTLGWNVSKARNGHVKSSVCDAFRKELRVENAELHSKINKVVKGVARLEGHFDIKVQ